MKQSGYALLLSLFVVLGVGSFWLVGSSALYFPNYRNQALELERAKQALISYAINYIDHYSAQGAGVGHLPCPDTDSPDLSHSDPWVRDGPNPPCARQDVELGWLPRHVSTKSGRYHFHNRNRQRLWYAVSGKFINNPLNRIVNPSTVGNINVGGFDDVVAVLTLPDLELGQEQSLAWWMGDNIELNRFPYTVILNNDIRVPAMRRVSDWLLARLNPEMNPSPCELGAELNMLHWVSNRSVNPDCAAHKKELLSEFALLEGVPYARHWFVRNEWFDYLEFKFEPVCLEPDAPQCEFVVAPTKVGDQTLTVSLSVSETVL